MQADDNNAPRPTPDKMSPAVIQALVEAHAGFRQFLQRRLRSEEDADDVMQDFWLRVIEKASQVRREESIRAWMRQVLQSVLTDHLRRQAARQRAEADFARKEEATPISEEDLDAAVCMCLRQVLPALRPEYAEIIQMIDLEDQPRDRVANALGLSLGNVTVRLHRARRAMRDLLALTCETCPIHGFLDCGCEYTKKLRAGHPVGDGWPTEV